MSDAPAQEEATAGATAAPVLRVVNPDATPEEIAALVAVFSAIGGGEAADRPRPRSEWASPERLARRTLQRHLPHGRGAWRSSGLPH